MSTYAIGTPDTWSGVPGNLIGGVEMAAGTLADGSVLICGGRKTGNRATAYAWIYREGSLSATAQPMGSIRWGHTLTPLGDGRVLVAGSAIPRDASCQTAELYDPPTRAFTATGAMNQARGYHTATLLKSGPAMGQVLLAGGVNALGTALKSAELYDPKLGRFTPLPAVMQQPRARHTATVLADGRVLLVSGLSAEVFDPGLMTFAATAGPKVSRSWHAAVLLSDGPVLIAGGYDSGQGPQALEEVWSPNGTMRYVGQMGDGDFDKSRFGPSLTRLPNGKVLAVGGSSYANPDQIDPGISGITRLYDPATGQFSTLPTAPMRRAFHVAVPLVTGQVLLLGGVTIGRGPVYPDTGQAYCPNPAPLTLTLEFAGTGRGSVLSVPPGLAGASASSAYFPAGTTVTLKATPGPSRIVAAAGMVIPGRPKPASVITNRFDGWSGDASGTGATCTVLMDRNKTAVAGFTEVRGTVTAPQKPPIRVPF